MTLAARPSAAADHAADLASLLDGVTTIAKPGVPGPVAVFGDDAFAVMTGTARGTVHHAVVAAARFADGRAVAFGHTGYLGRESLLAGDTGALVVNAVRWVGGSRDETRVAVRDLLPLAEHLRQQPGLAVETALNLAQLDEIDVVILKRIPDDETALDRLRAFVERGGGLVTAQLGWGWQQLNGEKSLRDDFAANRLFAEFGLLWAHGTFSSIDPVATPIDTDRLAACHAAEALRQIGGGRRGQVSSERSEQSTAVLTTLVRVLPRDDKQIRPQIERITKRAGRRRPIESKRPVKSGEALTRLAYLLDHIERADLPPRRIKADPSAKIFPGPVPRDARPRAATVTIDTSIPGWASTGRYAPPGEVITIGLPEDVGSSQKLFVRIGCHTDRLWDKPEWKRHPEITMRRPLREAQTELASPFGGLVYIEVPRNARPARLDVAIDGTVAAPRFVLGETELQEWREAIRHAPGPWAELQAQKIIITTHSNAVRNLDDPTELLEFWDRALDCYAELGQRPLPRRPERFVPDIQISAGYMHSGYPIMMHLDQVDKLVEPRGFGANWGWWHELGHNHQQGAWTFAGTGEVTCNLFTLYVIEHFTGQPAAGHERVLKHAAKARQYQHGGANFERWKREPFLALSMYMELQAAFGWDAYKTVFAEYRDLPRDARPRTDAEKRDQWMVRFSRAVGHNLGPFFTRWGVPTSDEARASIEDLPVWMPE
ncbi:MAG: M60 family metallopeptidase [Planctomycetota bacterium]